MATPALRALRRGLPEAEIAVLGLPHHEGLLRGNPSFDAFVPLRGRALRDVAARARELRGRGFDAAVLLPDSRARGARSVRRAHPGRGSVMRATRCAAALLSRRARIRRASAGQRVPISMIERYLRVARALGVRDAGDALELHVHADAARARAKRCSRARASRAASACCWSRRAPRSARASSGRRSTSRARATSSRRRLGLLPVLAPAPNAAEIAIAQRVCRARCAERHVVLLEPDPSLEVFVALVARAALVLTNDTGPRHVAVALGRPVVTLMGPTDPRHTAHLLERQRVLREDVACSPCGRSVCPIGDQRCMVRLAPERAVAAAAELLVFGSGGIKRHAGRVSRIAADQRIAEGADLPSHPVRPKIKLRPRVRRCSRGGTLR